MREDRLGDTLTSLGSVKWKGSDLTFHPSVAFSLFFVFQYGSRSFWILDCFAFENTAPHPSECLSQKHSYLCRLISPISQSRFHMYPHDHSWIAADVHFSVAYFSKGEFSHKKCGKSLPAAQGQDTTLILTGAKCQRLQDSWLFSSDHVGKDLWPTHPPGISGIPLGITGWENGIPCLNYRVIHYTLICLPVGLCVQLEITFLGQVSL